MTGFFSVVNINGLVVPTWRAVPWMSKLCLGTGRGQYIVNLHTDSRSLVFWGYNFLARRTLRFFFLIVLRLAEVPRSWRNE